MHVWSMFMLGCCPHVCQCIIYIYGCALSMYIGTVDVIMHEVMAFVVDMVVPR